MVEQFVSEELVREIAEKIVKEQILDNWLFYLLIFAITLLASALSSYLTSRFSKSGELAAITANFETLNKQLDTQTRIVKKIDTEISFSDYKAREWNALRRTKLEELMNEASAGKDWVILQAQKGVIHAVLLRQNALIALKLGDTASLTAMEKFELELPVNIEKVGNLTHLYFRELIDAWEKYEFVSLEFLTRIQEIHRDLIGIQVQEVEKYEKVLKQANEEIRDKTTKLVITTKELRNRASSLITEIMGVKSIADDA